MFEILFLMLSIVVIEPYFTQYYHEYKSIIDYIFLCHLYLYGLFLVLEKIYTELNDILFSVVITINFIFSLINHLIFCKQINIPVYIYPSIIYLNFVIIFILNITLYKLIRFFYMITFSMIEMICKKHKTSVVEVIESFIHNTKDPPKNICGICYEPSHLYFIDCGHVLCKECGLKTMNVCPYCRKVFYMMKRIYFP